MIKKLSSAEETTKAVYDILYNAGQLTGVSPSHPLLDDRWTEKLTEITIDSQKVSHGWHTRSGVHFERYDAVKHLFDILQQHIQESKPKGITLSALTDKRHWSDDSLIARFTLTFTPEADKSEAITIIKKTIQEFARKLNYSDMDMTSAVSHSYFESINGYAKDDEKTFRKAADTLLSIGQQANMPAMVSAIESIYKDMDNALLALQEKRIVKELRYKREQLGFNSIKELSDHSRSDGKGFAGREAEKEKAYRERHGINKTP